MSTGHYATIGGLQLYYEVHEPEDPSARDRSPPLVLLHGGGSSIETSFADLLPAIAKHRRVIAFDQQGHGRTADVDRPFSFEQSADDAAGLLRVLKTERADFLGFSNGGTIALQIAIRHPQLARKLVVVSGIYKRDALPTEFWVAMKIASVESMPLELRESYLRIAPHPEHLHRFHDKSARRMLDFRDIDRERLVTITAPALILVGDRDVVRLEHAVEMFRALPHAELAVLPGVDHMAMPKQLARHAPTIETFLDSA